jgi:hypothetical protein
MSSALDGLSDAIRAHRDLLVWAVVGRASRHAWVPCDECGHAVLLDPAPRWAGRLAWPHCYLTPGCSGRHLSVPSTGALSVGEVHRTVGERRPITDARAWFAAVSFVMGFRSVANQFTDAPHGGRTMSRGRSAPSQRCRRGNLDDQRVERASVWPNERHRIEDGTRVRDRFPQRSEGRLQQVAVAVGGEGGEIRHHPRARPLGLAGVNAGRRAVRQPRRAGRRRTTPGRRDDPRPRHQ